jgi:uroporphyrin-3 C-methyltransferase
MSDTKDDPPDEKSNPAATAGPAPTTDWTELAASLSADKARPGARSSATTLGRGGAEVETSRAPPQRGGSFAGALALVLSLVAIGVSGMLWWQYREFYVSLDSNDTAAAQALERVRAEQRALQDGIKDVSEDVDTLRQRSASIGDRVDALPGRFGDLERRLDAVQGGSFDARGALLRSEAEYYLRVANTELTLANDWDNAITALELADGRLAELGTPELAPVREKIAGELLALRGVRLPDVEGLMFSLGRLAARAPDLPMRADLPANYSTRDGGAQEDAEPGFERLWVAVKRTLLGLVRVERRDAPVDQALSAAERELARRQVELEIELARVAALRAQAQAFQSAIDRAAAILQRDFDADAAEVEGALALLREMRALEIDPQRPDISGSLTQLRDLAAGER